MSIGERIKAVRDAKGMSQQAFAESINVSGPSIYKVEKGINTPAARTIDAICYKHNVNPKWLNGEETDDSKMFLEPLSKAEKLDELMVSDNEFIRSFLEACADFSDEEWLLLEKIANKVAAKNKKKES